MAGRRETPLVATPRYSQRDRQRKMAAEGIQTENLNAAGAKKEAMRKKLEEIDIKEFTILKKGTLIRKTPPDVSMVGANGTLISQRNSVLQDQVVIIYHQQ